MGLIHKIINVFKKGRTGKELIKKAIKETEGDVTFIGIDYANNYDRTSLVQVVIPKVKISKEEKKRRKLFVIMRRTKNKRIKKKIRKRLNNIISPAYKYNTEIKKEELNGLQNSIGACSNNN